MSIRLLKNNQLVEISFTKVDQVYEAENPWKTGEDYTLEIDTSTLDGIGVSLRLPGAPEAPRRLANVTDSEDPADPLEIAPLLDEFRPGEDLPNPASVESTEAFTTMGSSRTYKVAAGWGRSRFTLQFRPKSWSREYVIQKA